MLNTKTAPNELDVHALLRTFSWIRFGVALTIVLGLSLSRPIFSAEAMVNKTIATYEQLLASKRGTQTLRLLYK